VAGIIILSFGDPVKKITTLSMRILEREKKRKRVIERKLGGEKE
jgi:hypothetical protein